MAFEAKYMKQKDNAALGAEKIRLETFTVSVGKRFLQLSEIIIPTFKDTFKD